MDTTTTANAAPAPVATPTTAQQLLAYAEAFIGAIGTLGAAGADVYAAGAKTLADLATFKAENRVPTPDEWAAHTTALAANSADLQAQAAAAQKRLDAGA